VCRKKNARRDFVDDLIMDMFLLFVVIFVCVMLGLGMSALALSLLFRVIVRFASGRAPRVAVAAAASSPSTQT